jgi:hypothetical protein
MKVVILIDGGFLRACAQRARITFDNTLIESFSRACRAQDEYWLRTLYYDSPQFRGTVTLPVSGKRTEFNSSDKWLDELATCERFAVRRGNSRLPWLAPKENANRWARAD